jgi:hypothetical protein
MDAMPVLIGFVADGRSSVRNAARWALSQYGRNAVWQYRRAYRLHAGEAIASELDWEATRDALYAAIDGQRLAPAHAELDAALSSLRDGDLAQAERRLGAVLGAAPDTPRRAEVSAAYTTLARLRATRDPVAAEGLYRRALHLAASAPASSAIRAELLVFSARHSIDRGVADTDALESAIALVPEHEVATRMLAELTGRDRGDVSTRRVAVTAVAALLGLVALAVVALRRRRAPQATAPDPTIETLPG